MTPEREGLDRLLAQHPDLQVWRIWRTPSWLCVDLIEPEHAKEWPGPQYARGEQAVPVQEFAIWRRTGNVYALDVHGAAGDDPIIVVTTL